MKTLLRNTKWRKRGLIESAIVLRKNNHDQILVWLGIFLGI